MKSGLLLKVGVDSTLESNFVGNNWRNYKNSKNESIYVRGTVLKRNDAEGGELGSTFFEEEFGLDYSAMSGLKGSFSIIVTSGKAARAYSSAFGIYHLFYSPSDDGGYYITDNFSLYAERIQKIELDPLIVASTAIFNFPIAEDCLIQGFKKVPSGSMLKVEKEKVDVSEWYDYNWIYAPVDSTISFDDINDAFVKTLSSYTKGVDQIAVSITGGFDGRTVLSAVPKRLAPLLYTFGVQNSHDIEIGKKVARKLGLKHQEYLIDQEYYNNTYEKLTRYILTHANGLINHRRTHYVNAFSSLSDQVDKVFTGNVGSELFRSINHSGLHLPKIVFKLVKSDSREEVVDQAVSEFFESNTGVSIDKDLLKNHVLERVNQMFTDNDLPNDSYLPFFKFLIQQTFSNWYGSEMSIESHWVENRAVFLDDEFVELVSRSQYGSKGQSSSESNPMKRRIGQLSYSEIIKRNSKALFRLPTSKGYSPADISSSFGLIKTSLAFVTKRFRKNVNEFNSKETTNVFLNKFPAQSIEKPNWYQLSNPELEEAISVGSSARMNIGIMLYFQHFVNNQS